MKLICAWTSGFAKERGIAFQERNSLSKENSAPYYFNPEELSFCPIHRVSVLQLPLSLPIICCVLTIQLFQQSRHHFYIGSPLITYSAKQLRPNPICLILYPTYELKITHVKLRDNKVKKRKKEA